MSITVNSIKDYYDVELCKMNKQKLCGIPFEFLDDMDNDFEECSVINLVIPKYYITDIGKKRKLYPPYNMIKSERYLKLDEYYYIIKEVKKDDANEQLQVTAYSKEKKLEKNKIEVEDLGFYILDKNEEKNIFSLDEYMYEQTGWRFGHVDESVRYNEDGSLKMRWQESIDTSWLDYLRGDFSEQFQCYLEFDSSTNRINIYDINNYGNELKLELCYDNYLKSIESDINSNELVTKYKLIGNEDCVIEDYTPTGEPYIENYSYFIENNEMSNELINALNLFYEITAERRIQWKLLVEEKLTIYPQVKEKESRETVVVEEIKVCDTNIEIYNEYVGTDKDVNGIYSQKLVEEQIKKDKLTKERLQLSEELYNLGQRLEQINSEIDKINILCRKPTATDRGGALIFNQELLDELKEFTYYDTFSDDGYLIAEEMISVGDEKLSVLSKPTREWSVDVEDFSARLVSNSFRKQWNGVLSLCDVISLLYSDGITKEYLYITGFSKKFQEKTLTITLSNKKKSVDYVKDVNYWLKVARNNNKIITKFKPLWISQKYDEININGESVK